MASAAYFRCVCDIFRMHKKKSCVLFLGQGTGAWLLSIVVLIIVCIASSGRRSTPEHFSFLSAILLISPLHVSLPLYSILFQTFSLSILNLGFKRRGAGNFSRSKDIIVQGENIIRSNSNGSIITYL